jgi:hypothetical protein
MVHCVKFSYQRCSRLSAEWRRQGLGGVMWAVALLVPAGSSLLAQTTPASQVVVIHAELRRFRDYLHDLYSKVQALYWKGSTLEDVPRGVHMEKYSDFRQYEKYDATFAHNAAVISQQLQHH